MSGRWRRVDPDDGGDRDLLVDIMDLYVQATTEASHFYTGSVLKRCIAELARLYKMEQRHAR